MMIKKVFVAGHNGMVGKAICDLISKNGHEQILSAERNQLDLTNQSKVAQYFATERPDSVIIAAAKVGGIKANSDFPADFIYENLQIQCNIIHQAHLANIQSLIFLGSSCIYPKLARQPISENELLSGMLEITNEPYAIAKISGLKMCESYNRQFGRDYRALMPTNLYGPNDNFHLENCHVIPALIKKFHHAKVEGLEQVEVWGSGKPLREFLHVQDLASACMFIRDLDKKQFFEDGVNNSHVNVGTGKDISIKDLSLTIKSIVEFNGDINFNSSMPDGTPRKLLNVNRINSFGWKGKIALKEGLEQTYNWYKNNLEGVRS